MCRVPSSRSHQQEKFVYIQSNNSNFTIFVLARLKRNLALAPREEAEDAEEEELAEEDGEIAIYCIFIIYF